MTVYANPGTDGSIVTFKPRYENYIGGEWVPPVEGQYMDNITPVTGEVFCQVARSSAADVDKALDAAHAARESWATSSPAERARVLNNIADRMEQHLEQIAVAETWEMVSRFVKLLRQIFRLQLITIGTLRVRFALKKAIFHKLITTPLPTIP